MDKSLGDAEIAPSVVLPKRENANLDVLRTIAVLLVFVHHLLEFFGIIRNGGWGMHLGHWGVLLFFVHTSFVLMLSLERQARGQTRANYWVFLLRRVFRLFPLSLLVVATVCTFHMSVGIFDNQHFAPARFDLKTVLSNVFLVQNLTHTDSVLATLWTLPYEIQMYLVLPALFLLAARAQSIGPVLLVWVLSAVAGKLLAFNSFIGGLAGFAPCFIAGVVGYRLEKSARLHLPFLGWPALLLLFTLLFQFHPGRSTSWLLCLVVGAAAVQFRELAPGALQRFCQLIARYSYGIYLTHLICIWFAFVVLDGLPTYAQWLVFAVTASVSPVLLYHTIEAPMIALGARLTRRLEPGGPSQTVPAGAALG